MLDHLHQISKNQFVGNFRAYLHAKNQLHHVLLSQEIANLFFFWGDFGMTGHIHLNDSINLKKP